MLGTRVKKQMNSPVKKTKDTNFSLQKLSEMCIQKNAISEAFRINNKTHLNKMSQHMVGTRENTKFSTKQAKEPKKDAQAFAFCMS
jgi:hypothetical protein